MDSLDDQTQTDDSSRAAASGAARSHIGAEQEHRLRVALLDPARLMRAGLRSLLEALTDVEVVGEADDAASGLQVMEQQAPEVLIVDLDLVSADQFALVRELHTHHPECHVLGITGRVFGDTIKTVLEAGLIGLLSRTSAPEELPLALDMISRGEVYMSPCVSGVMISRMRRRRDRFPQTEKHRQVVFTNRQRQILRRLGQGLTNKQIAEDLGISVKTVETHRARAMKALGLHRGHQLLQFAIRNFADFAND